MKDIDFADYLRGFDYRERADMKIGVAELLDLYAAGRAQLVDIRFKEEYAAWHLAFGQNIPLNELPDRLDELDPDKLIVTTCPYNARAEIARLFLITKGYRSRYLVEGVMGIATALRGETARDYMAMLHAREQD